MSSDEHIQIEDFEIRLVKSARAKHILLKQNAKGEIILTCPRLCPKIVAVRFAKTQIEWIRAHVLYAPQEKVFTPNQTIRLLGREYLLKQGSNTTEQEGVLSVSGDASFFHRRVCSYAQRQLLKYIQTQVADLTRQLGVKAGRITLRNTSSRWGSCSSTHNLSFCWKIAFAPLDVIDYLIAHEVAHLAEMNHSPRFWKVVDQLTSKRLMAERWLKKNGRELQTIK